ncbi:hypothetical protein C8J56DRAFT_1164932 [Mycena floridula]|nr:hypothetical protein C8J56DRAFT_1164932 [Mycena floridula]
MPKAPPASASKAPPAAEKEKREPNPYQRWFKVEYAQYKLEHPDMKLKDARAAVSLFPLCSWSVFCLWCGGLSFPVWWTVFSPVVDCLLVLVGIVIALWKESTDNPNRGNATKSKSKKNGAASSSKNTAGSSSKNTAGSSSKKSAGSSSKKSAASSSEKTDASSSDGPTEKENDIPSSDI